MREVSGFAPPLLPLSDGRQREANEHEPMGVDPNVRI